MNIERNDAIALAVYLNKCVGIVPTTGMEWDACRRVLAVIEGIANAQMTVEVKTIEPVREVQGGNQGAQQGR